jgi:hypothetical protein
MEMAYFVQAITATTGFKVNNGLTALFVLSFATNASGDVFAGTYFGNGVFRSTDDGDSWNEKNNGLIATEVRTIAA